MRPASISLLTICGLDELEEHRTRGVSHVLSILDPAWPEPEAFRTYDAHHRTTLHFHDIIDPAPGRILPERGDMEAILEFGRALQRGAGERREGHLLIHCHMGISRSTAAMAAILAQANPQESEDGIFAHLAEMRPQIWPNSLMIQYADDLLGREGRFVAALRRLYARQLAARPERTDPLLRGGRGREVAMAEGL